MTCWGYNRYGQSPLGAFKNLSVGYDHACGVRVDDTVTCWGGLDYRSGSDPGRTEASGGAFKMVSAGFDHSCGVRVDDTVTCWGDNDWEQSDAPEGGVQNGFGRRVSFVWFAC